MERRELRRRGRELSPGSAHRQTKNACPRPASCGTTLVDPSTWRQSSWSLSSSSPAHSSWPSPVSSACSWPCCSCESAGRSPSANPSLSPVCEPPAGGMIPAVSSVRAAAVSNVERYGRSSRRAAPPGSLPHQQAKGTRLHRSSCGADTRSAWCVERRSPRAREASSSNPEGAAGVVGQTPPTSNPAILSHCRVEAGRQGTTRRTDQVRRAVSNEAGAAGATGANPAAGVRATAASMRHIG